MLILQKGILLLQREVDKNSSAGKQNRHTDPIPTQELLSTIFTLPLHQTVLCLVCE
jgi:hypothetical protein